MTRQHFRCNQNAVRSCLDRGPTAERWRPGLVSVAGAGHGQTVTTVTKGLRELQVLF